MSWGRYGRYCPSGIEWPAETPAHWSTTRLRFALRLNPSRQEAKQLATDAEVSFVTMDAVGEQGGLRLDSSKPLDEIPAGYTYFADGDVVVAKITPCFENGKGALAEGLLNGSAFGTTELHVLRAEAKALDPKFLFYLTASQPFRKLGEAAMYGAGGQKRVPEDFIKDFRAALPPLAEQQQIANVLDRETARLDSLIDKRQRMIKLLQEKRAALITHAVTCGLDPDVPLKDSKVEWLGLIPEHWAVKSLRHVVASIEQGWSPLCDNHQAGDSEWGVLKAGAVNGTQLDESEQKHLPDELTPAIEYEIRSGDVLMSRANTLELMGSAVFVERVRPRLLLCDKLYRLRISYGSPINAKFLVHVLRSPIGRAQLQREATGTSGSMQNIGQDTVQRVQLPVPPKPEQESIVQFLRSETDRLDALNNRLVDSISVLNEYRAALITAAVTGQIDVRT